MFFRSCFSCYLSSSLYYIELKALLNIKMLVTWDVSDLPIIINNPTIIINTSTNTNTRLCVCLGQLQAQVHPMTPQMLLLLGLGQPTPQNQAFITWTFNSQFLLKAEMITMNIIIQLNFNSPLVQLQITTTLLKPTRIVIINQQLRQAHQTTSIMPQVL